MSVNYVSKLCRLREWHAVLYGKCPQSNEVCSLHYQTEILGYLKEICEREKQLIEQQRQTQERLDALIAVLSRSPEQPNVPALTSLVTLVTTVTLVTSVPPVPAVQTLSAPELDSPSACPSQSADDDVVFSIMVKVNFGEELFCSVASPYVHTQ